MKPLFFESNPQKVLETENEFNTHLSNILSNNGIHVKKVDREFSLGKGGSKHSYKVILEKNEETCSFEAELNFSFNMCSEHKEKCEEILQDCIEKLGSIGSTFDDEEPLKNKSESEEKVEEKVQEVKTQTKDASVQVTEEEDEAPVH